MKMKLFTHTDLDGVGCAIAMRSLFREDEGHVIDVTYCDYDKINDKVTNFIENKTDVDMKDYDFIFITDISVNLDVAMKLEAVDKSDDGPFVQLLDHHATADWLNEYDWALVDPAEPNRPGHKSSGTTLVLHFFDVQRPGFERKVPDSLRDFAETVRKYDTWEWATHYNETTPKELNDYLYMIGREEFANYILHDMPLTKDGKPIYFNEKARALLDQKQKEIKAYIEKKDKQLIKVKKGPDSYYGIVFAELHVSELGNELCKKHEDIEFIAMIDMGERKISFRTVRDDIHLGELAKKIGGGGHPKAAGASFEEQNVVNFLATIL